MKYSWISKNKKQWTKNNLNNIKKDYKAKPYYILRKKILVTIKKWKNH